MKTGWQWPKPVYLADLAVLLLLCTKIVRGHLQMTSPPALGSENSPSPRDYDLTAPLKGTGPYVQISTYPVENIDLLLTQFAIRALPRPVWNRVSALCNRVGFPCKGKIQTMPPGIARTPYNAGEEVSVVISGVAVHGGGSCQIALS